MARTNHTVSKRRCLAGFEPLESRSLLSAIHGSNAPVTMQSLDLSIQGTAIQYSPAGLPSAITGDIFVAAAGPLSAHRVGSYSGVFTPILMDINGDQIPDFVGTRDVSTYNFFAGSSQHVFESITTQDVSLIQGITASGQLIVGSQGVISGSEGFLSNLAGSFSSQSVVTLGPTFAMQTAVHFTFNHLSDVIVSTSDAKSIDADGNSNGGAAIAISSPQADKPTSERGPDFIHRDDNKTLANVINSSAADHAFETGIDWRLEHLAA